MTQPLSLMIVGGLIRMAQGFAAAAPTLLVGLLIASILRYYLGTSGTRKLFGGDSLRSLPQSWLVGMLLPVCSIGVLPILLEMRRARVKPGAMSAFALSAPLFNPLSLLYGLTLSRPLVIILFALASLLIVTGLGFVWDAIEKNAQRRRAAATADASAEEPIDSLIGMRRVIATMVHFARELTGVNLALTLIALSGLAILAAALPFAAMQNSVECDDLWAPLTMMFVAIPVYATPMLAMSQLGMMFQHANSPGASFALLILGTGMNLATLFWFAWHYGVKAAMTWMAALLAIVLALSYAINQPLIPPGVEPAGHTHAFDIYVNPLTIHHPMTVTSLWKILQTQLDVATIAALGVLAIIAAVGLVLRLMKIDEAWLIKTANAHSFASSLRDEDFKRRGTLDWVVPPSLIGATMLVGMVGVSIVGCYAYYPSPEECLEEIRLARGECLTAANSGQAEHALFWLPVWEDWSRRLEVGTFIRTGEVRPYQRMQGYLVRKKLELLEHELEHDPPELEETQEVVRSLLSTSSRWTAAFRR